MRSRLDLHNELIDILGSKNVYFQPPENIKLKYPCIVYYRSDIRPDWADNIPYQLYKQYKITLIYKDPDSELPDKIALLPYTRMSNHMVSDNLNHDIFTIFY